MPLLVSFSYPLTIPSDLTLSLPPHPLTLRSLSSPSSSHPQISLFVLIPVPILSHPPSSSFSLFPLSSHPPSLILFISSSLSPHAVSSSPYCRRRRPSSPTLSRRRRDASPSDLPVIKDVLEISAVLNSKWKRQQELIYITTYDLLFGKEFSSFGTAEKYLFQRKAALDSALEKVLVKKKEKRVEDLLSQYETPALYLTNLKLDVDSAFNELAKLCTVKKDDLVPDLLLLPPGVDLHDHPLVKNGSVFLQGKGSSMVAVALGPQPGWQLRAILLDPSCSGSGTAVERLDHLLPSNMNNKAGASDIIRLTKLAGFQKKALEHALSYLGQTRLGRIVIAGGRQFLGKLNSARKNFPSKVFLLLLGFYTANALATILGQTGDWDVLVAGIVVAAIEGIGMLMYRRNMLSSGRLQPLVVLVNYWKAGVCLGLFVDAFKLGS